jgi:hypothetical protein
VSRELGSCEITQDGFGARFPHGEIVIRPLPTRRLLLVALGANAGADVAALSGVGRGLGKGECQKQQHASPATQ